MRLTIWGTYHYHLQCTQHPKALPFQHEISTASLANHPAPTKREHLILHS